MNDLQKEEIFKELLEKLIKQMDRCDNLINFMEENNFDSNLVDDFVEELTKYEEDVKRVFKTSLFNIDTYSSNIEFNKKVIDNVAGVIDIINNLSSDDFEKLCALYIDFLGTTRKPNITKKSHDQGIDFVGIIEKDSNYKLFEKGQSVNKIYLVGQAKHYGRAKVTSKEVRELAGALYLLKNRNFALLADPYKNLEIKAFTPIYAYFITSYYFTHSAIQLCDNADIMAIDRILLSLTFGLSEQFQKDGDFKSDLLYESLKKVDYIS